MKARMIFFIIISLLISNTLYSQSNISNKTIDEAVKKIVFNLESKFKSIATNSIQQILVMPVYDKNKKVTELSKLLTMKIAHQLNLKLKNDNLQFNARSYDELSDTLINKTLNKLIVNSQSNEDESQKLQKILEAKKIDYLITGSYIVDSDNNTFVIENTKIVKNWLEKMNVEMISVSNASTVLEKQYGFPSIWRSALVPGWGQLYKKEKWKGLSILAGEGILISGFFISDNISYNYYQKAVQNRDSQLRKEYLTSSENWTTARNVFGIAAAVVYVYNVIDAISSKRNNEYAFNKKYNIDLFTDANKGIYGLTFKLNLK